MNRYGTQPGVIAPIPAVAIPYLTRLIEFIQGLSPVMAGCRFEFSPHWGTRIQGEASWLEETAPGAAIFPVRIRIALTAPGSRPYPTRESYVPELEPLQINSWEEELLLVLAHEMRHGEQFLTQLGPSLKWDAHAMEVDAESFAYVALGCWRNHQKYFTKKAA